MFPLFVPWRFPICAMLSLQLGLLLLSCRVAFGVASGELDMQATQTIARKG